MTSHHAAATSWLLEFYDVVSSPPSSTTSLAFAGIGGTIEPENSRSNSMKLRIAKWACAGFLIAGFWALYFAVSSPASPIEPIASILTRITCPIALLRSYPLSQIPSLRAYASKNPTTIVAPISPNPPPSGIPYYISHYPNFGRRQKQFFKEDLKQRT